MSIIPKSANKRKAYVKLCKNCNFPMARDARLAPRWRKSKPNGLLWLADLGGEERIQLALPLDVDEQLKRFPTAFDMNVLLFLLRQTEFERSDEIKFRSLNAMMKVMRLPLQSREREKLRSSLQFWSQLMVRFAEWWDTNKHKDGERGVRVWYRPAGRLKVGGKLHKWRARERRVRGKVCMILPPPIEQQDGWRLRISSEWLVLAHRFYELIPLPLPQRAAAQNLCVWLLGGKHELSYDDDDEPYIQAKLRQMDLIIAFATWHCSGQ
jgi:hypothetical protein